MGTSSARRGPGTAAWRMAKGAATRYLSAEGGAPLKARELVRRYVAALQETGAAQGQDLLSGFRLTRKAAQSLGEFGDIAAQSGLAAALAGWGLEDVAQASPETAIAGLISAWLEDQGGLEAAVARTALAACLEKVLSASPTSPPGVNGPSLVKSFLAIMLSQRLAASIRRVRDLGSSPVLALYSPIPGTKLWPAALAASPYDLENEPLYHNNSLFPCWPAFSWERYTRLKRLAQGS